MQSRIMPRSGDPNIGPLYDYEGRVNQAVAGDFVVLPWHLELRDRGILYGYFDPKILEKKPEERQLRGKNQLNADQMRKAGLSTLKIPNPRVLDGFMKLAEAPDEAILSFAGRWGVLDLCTHGLPATHKVGALRWGIPRPAGCDLVKPPHPRFPSWSHYGFERTDRWRAWAARARSMMRIAAALRSYRRGDEADWKTVSTFEDGERTPWPRRDDDVLAEWRLLSEYVNGWCELANVTPYLVSRGKDEVVVRFGSRTHGRLFGTLGLQMLARISQIGSMALCASCSEIYKPSRIPHPSRLNFCKGCGRETAVRLAKQRESSKKRRVRELSAEGKSAAAIAREVGSKLSTVKRWIGGAEPAVK